MNTRTTLIDLLTSIVNDLGHDLPTGGLELEHPTELSHGDYATNIALALAKSAGKNPRELASEIAAKLTERGPTSLIESVEVAGPGFINLRLAPVFFAEQLDAIMDAGDQYGHNQNLVGKRIMVEYTDPNPFKQFHIGHLMTNAIGETIARLYQAGGATVLRANYQGDVGRHVARAIWGMQSLFDDFPALDADLSDKVKFLGAAYVAGASADQADTPEYEAISTINRAVFERSDTDINRLYDLGRQWSLDHFEEIYAKLGTAFDYYFFESEMATAGMQIVAEQKDAGVFVESDGAIVFPGEDYGLHTRVFINSIGLPTYEAKDIGLNTHKFTIEPDLDQSIIITGSEQSAYFAVVFKAFEQVLPVVAEHTTHIGHGLMLGPDGSKMSSRQGKVITGESLIAEMEELALKRITEGERDVAEPQLLATDVAIAAIKFMILRQQIGKNIVFDYDQALSFEGDSGPYLQYTYARTQSILERAEGQGIDPRPVQPEDWEVTSLERIIYRLPEVIERAQAEMAPQLLLTHLIELARAYNSYYGETQIVDVNDPASSYRLALTATVGITLYNGLQILGIRAPQRM